MAAGSSSRLISALAWILLIALSWLVGGFLSLPLDTQIYRALALHTGAADSTARLVLLEPGARPPMEQQVVERRTLHPPVVGTLELNDASASAHFAALPLAPQDVAVLLNKIRQAGISTLGLSSPLTWDNEPGAMAREMLCQVISQVPHAAVGLRGRTAAQADFTPLVLRDTAIPPENVQGDTTGLPVANRPLPNGLTETPDALSVTWAPDWLQDEPLTQRPSSLPHTSFPLLMLWNGEVIPTLPLRLAMMHLGLKPEQIQVRLGQDIRLGSRTLPLDEHGRTQLRHATTRPISLEDILKSGEALQQQLGHNAGMILEHPGDGRGNPQRLELLAKTLSEVAAREDIRHETTMRPAADLILRQTPRTQSWSFRLGLTLALLVMLFLVPHMPSLLRKLIYAGGAAWLGWLLYQGLREGWCYPFSAALLCWAMACLAASCRVPQKKGIFSRKH